VVVDFNRIRHPQRASQVAVFYALVAASIVLFGCGDGKQESPAIATVGKDKLTADELIAEIPQEMKGLIGKEQIQEYVQRWINSELLLQEARRRGLDRKVELQWALRKMERELLVSKLLEQELDKRRLVTEEDIRTYYEQNQSDFTRESAEVRLYHILTPTLEQAKEIMRRLRGGEKFEAIAEEETAADSGNRPWDLGYVSPDELISQASKKVFRARKGAVIPPIHSEFGYHIFKVVDKQPKGSVKTLDEVREEITIKLTAQKRQQRFHQLLARLRNQTEITTDYQVLDQVLQAAADSSNPTPGSQNRGVRP